MPCMAGGVGVLIEEGDLGSHDLFTEVDEDSVRAKTVMSSNVLSLSPPLER